MKGKEVAFKHRPSYYLRLLTTVLVSFSCSVYKEPSLASAFSLGTLTQVAQDQNDEAKTLVQKGFEQFRRSQFQAALETYQAVLKRSQQSGDKAGEGETLYSMAVIYRCLARYSQALDHAEQAVRIAQTLSDRILLGRTLTEIGTIHTNLGQYPKAIEYYQQALAISRESSDSEALLRSADRTTQAHILDYWGSVYRLQGQYDQALKYHQQALSLSQEISERTLQARILNNIGIVYEAKGDYSQALKFEQQALAVSREAIELPKDAPLRDSFASRLIESRILISLGIVSRNQGQYSQALEFNQQALAIQREIGDKAGEGRSVNNIATVYDSQGQYSQALEYHQKALAIRREIGDKAGEGISLTNIGVVYWNLGQYSQALNYDQQALVVSREIGDKAGEGYILSSMGGVYSNQGQYTQALTFYQQALAIRREIGDKAGEGNTLNSMGGVYYSLGQYPQALEFYQQALAIRREIGDKTGEGITLNNIGLAYNILGQYDQAIKVYQQALAIRREIGDKAGEGYTLNNIALIYNRQEYKPQALTVFEQALAIRREIGDQAGEGTTLNNIGLVYQDLGQSSQALESYQLALGIFQAIGNRPGERSVLSNIGSLLEQQNQSELAVIFYKQSVNVTESIRQELRTLTSQQQQSYTQTVADTYRRLADLLLKQNRVLEAQQVLDLLKVQELDDYLGNVRGNKYKDLGIELLPQEQQIRQSLNNTVRQDRAIESGRELLQLRQIPAANRTQTQTQRIAELERIQQQIRQEFNDFIRSPEIVALTQQLNQTAGGQNLDLPNLNRLQQQLRQIKQNAVVLYPLILKDRLELVLVTPYSSPIRRTVPVKQEDLNQAILEFRRAITNKIGSANRVKPPAQKLYNLLIKPIENDLTQADVQTIIYAPDGQLRYIPLAALYDGNRWLVERFGINNITAASLINFNPHQPTQPHILAAAFTQGSYEFSVGTNRFAFSGLQFAGREVEDIAEKIPSTKKLLDRAFSRDATVPNLNDYTIVHLATHAAFVSGQPEESFILFGNGDRATLREIQTWNLTNVDLVVLSACQTGIGGILGNGEEILGLGYQMQQAGALATIASLWIVDDEGTQILMDAFYEALRQGSPKVEALRKAQIALVNSSYNHPYYWAPFILLGNGF